MAPPESSLYSFDVLPSRGAVGHPLDGRVAAIVIASPDGLEVLESVNERIILQTFSRWARSHGGLLVGHASSTVALPYLDVRNRQLAREGQLGPIVDFEVRWDLASPSGVEGAPSAALVNLGSLHHVDMARLQRPPTVPPSISADMDHDTDAARLRYVARRAEALYKEAVAVDRAELARVADSNFPHVGQALVNPFASPLVNPPASQGLSAAG